MMSPRSGLAQTFGPEHGVEIYVVFASESVTAVTYPRNWHHGRQHMSSTKHATLLERVSCMDLWRKMLLHSEAKALIPVARNEPPSHFYEYRDLMICAATEKIISQGIELLCTLPVTTLQ